MKIENFKNILKRMEVPFEEVEVTKNNNRILKGIAIGKETLRPTIYEDAIEELNDEVEVVKFIEEVRLRPGATEEIFVKERFENSVYIGVRNKKWNTEDKRTFTFEIKNFEDLEGYYYLRLTKRDALDLGIINMEEGEGTVKVNKDLMTQMDIDENWLKTHAEKNMLAKLSIKTMSETLTEIMLNQTDIPFIEEKMEKEITQLDDFMYVISNKEGHFGAGAIASDLCFEKIKEFAEKRDLKNWAILPSSIHEVLLVELEHKTKETETMLDTMVTEVNETEVPERDKLSDHAYIF